MMKKIKGYIALFKINRSKNKNIIPKKSRELYRAIKKARISLDKTK